MTKKKVVPQPRERPWRVRLTEEDLQRFEIPPPREAPRATRHLTLRAWAKNSDEPDLVVKAEVWQAVRRLAEACGYRGPALDGSNDLVAHDGNHLADCLKVAEAIARLARAGRGIRFGAKDKN